MSSNRVTLAQLDGMTTEEAAGLPMDHLALLLEDVADMKARANTLSTMLTAALDRRFGEQAASLRRSQGKDSGRVRFPVGNHIIVADLPKNPSWDQGLLAHALSIIRDWGEDISEYVTTEYKVSEARYAAWPGSIRKLFEPARTVGCGKPSYKIERKEAA